MPVLTCCLFARVQRLWNSRSSIPLFSLKRNLQPQMHWLLKFKPRSSSPALDDGATALRPFQLLINANRSALIVAASVVHMPCGKPL